MAPFLKSVRLVVKAVVLAHIASFQRISLSDIPIVSSFQEFGKDGERMQGYMIHCCVMLQEAKFRLAGCMYGMLGEKGLHGWQNTLSYKSSIPLLGLTRPIVQEQPPSFRIFFIELQRV